MASPLDHVAPVAAALAPATLPVDLEQLLGGPRRLRQFEAKLAAKLKASRQRVTVEFDPAPGHFAVHFVTREPL